MPVNASGAVLVRAPWHQHDGHTVPVNAHKHPNGRVGQPSVRTIGDHEIAVSRAQARSTEHGKQRSSELGIVLKHATH